MPKTPFASVVEDDRKFRDSMRRLISSLGYRVEVFASAADFLASPHHEQSTCLICDVQMPGMSGLDLHRALVERGCIIPTIIVTAYPNDADRNRALNDGAVCYLGKPLDEQHLVNCLLSALDTAVPPSGSIS